MLCPYPDCNNEIPPPDHLAYCSKCGQPSFACPHCGEPNRSPARHCHHCGRQIGFAGSQALSANGLAQREPRPVPPARLGEVNRLCPELTPYGGYLWGVSFYGDIYRLGRGVERLKKCCDLPGSGFKYPLLADADDVRGPLLYANGLSRLYRFSILEGKYEEVFSLDDTRRTFASGVVKVGKHFYFLTRDEGRGGALALRCVGPSGWDYPLDGLSPAESLCNPLRRIGDALWVFTGQKLLVFPQFSRADVNELTCNPWRMFSSEAGVWYAEKTQAGGSGETQSLVRAVFEEERVERSPLHGSFPVTARLAVDPESGQLAALLPRTIKRFDFGMNPLPDPDVVIDISNPECVLLAGSVVFWFEAGERTLYAWPVGTNRVWRVWSFDRAISFSNFFLNDRCLYGLANEEIWQWDLSG